jgi:hypothetical protein
VKAPVIDLATERKFRARLTSIALARAGAELAAHSLRKAGADAIIIDLAELLSRSIKAAGKPGPAKAKE